LTRFDRKAVVPPTSGDGKTDILWQNADGLPAIWEMNGTSIIGTAVLPNPAASWKVIGAGDYNSVHPDLVLLNTATDQVQIWIMNGMNVSSMQNVATAARSTAQPASANATAIPLSASPVLSGPDAYYASLAGGSGPVTFDSGGASGMSVEPCSSALKAQRRASQAAALKIR
jgi:hypothetical protein